MKIWGEIPKISGIYDKQKNLNKVDKTSGIASKQDIVSISNQAKDFQTVMKAVKEVPDIRADKVGELTKEYEAGEYDKNGKDVADKILKSILDTKA